MHWTTAGPLRFHAVVLEREQVEQAVGLERELEAKQLLQLQHRQLARTTSIIGLRACDGVLGFGCRFRHSIQGSNLCNPGIGMTMTWCVE